MAADAPAPYIAKPSAAMVFDCVKWAGHRHPWGKVSTACAILVLKNLIKHK